MRSHPSTVASAISGLVIASVVAAVAIVSTGYTAQRIDLGDGSVWVANSAQQAIGRANTEVLELNTVVTTAGNDVDVLQAGENVLLFDRAGSKADVVDPASSQVLESVPLPPNQPEVFLAGNDVVVFEQGTGEVWIVPWASFAQFDAESESSLSLGADAVVSVDPAGLMFAYSPSKAELYSLDATVTDAAEDVQTLTVAGAGDLAVTSVAGTWAVLDPDDLLLYLEGRTVDLSGLIDSGASAQLQWPSTGGDRVLVAHNGGLVSVPLSGAAAVGLTADQSGAAARPLVLEGCEFAAWTNGDAWRRCLADGDSGTSLSLDEMAGSATLTFMANGTRAVLNDRRTGEAWAVQREGELINNWDQLITQDEDEQQEQENNDDVPPEVEKVQLPPVAVNDAFGARPGRATVIPVLLNDYDPNGDVLVISDITPIDSTIGRLDLINERQQIQLTLAPGTSGQVVFPYTITDGRGGSASATVTVTVRQPDENSAPVQVRNTKAAVAAAGRVTTQVLGDWIDPDGDAFYLTSASVPAPDAVTYKAEGTIVYSDSGTGGDLKVISLVVSDGSAEGAGSVSVTVRPVGEVPITPDPFVVLVQAGQEVTISPLEHVRGGSGVLRLNSVPSKTGVTIVPSYDTGTFRFTSDQVRSHYLEYVVTDGAITATGVVRVDVTAPADPATRPVTVPKTVFVRMLQNQRIDVTATDHDPAGGVLVVTGVMNLASGSGVRAEVLDQRIVRVSIDAPLDNGPVTFNYRISNGLAEAEGVITVVQIPPLARIQPPIANDDTVTVRVGEAIDIPVLDNDEHPDGLDLTLEPKLDQELPEDSGLLFASGRVLRYLAPDKTGNFTAAYRVTGPDGQAATALVRIAVREADVDTNNAPVPETVTARVIAGETVRIRIPLTGIDPDGDSVQLLGQATSPEKGSVTSVEADTIVYEAGGYSTGTDTFNYTVIDSLGARATGTVRVGISPRLEGARNPVAIVDDVQVRPGVTVSVQALANDSDPDGSPLTIVSAVPTDEITTAEIIGDVVDITPPSIPGDYAVTYTIQNDKGGTSQNFIRVSVDEDAPLSYPVATDTVLTLSDVLDRDTVTVDVLANVFFADGDTRSLGLSVYPGYGDVAQVTANKRIVVTIENVSQIIPFRVTHPDDSTVFSYAFIRVPGLDDALPQIDRRAPALRVSSEEALVIPINDYVIAVGGKQVMLTDTSSVKATHANGDSLVVDSDTLVFTSADKYFGPASISFEVTDGVSATDPAGRTAIIVLPITVSARANQPPVFDGAVLEFEPGQERRIELLNLTTYPYDDDLDELVYSMLSPAPVGFEYALNGSVLTLRANDDAVKGSTTTATLTVRDDLNEGGAGRIDLRVVASTRPLAIAAPDTGVAARGGTTTIDVLANDQATNPFPAVPLRVVAIRGLDGTSLPAGVRIQPSADNSRLTATVDQSAAPGDITLQYQVADSTNDSSRYVWGSVTVSVQDRPDPIANLAPTGFGDRSITLRWNAGAANNSPITGYRVTASQGSTVISTTECTGTTCDIRTPGNGPENAVTVAVVAVNSIGASEPAGLSGQVWSDVIPPAPTAISSEPLDRGLQLSWNAVTTPSGGSAVDRYVVTVGGFSTDVSPSSCGGGTCTWSTTSAGWSLDNGVAVTFTISPRNSAYTALSVWNTSDPRSDIPAGPPIAVSSPSATATSDTTIAMDWAGVFAENGRPISSYTAAAYTGTAPSCSADGTISANGASLISAGTGTSATFSGRSPNETYSLVVFASNGQGCTASPVVIARTPPAVVTSITKSGPSLNGAGRYDYTITGGAMGGASLTSDYTIRYRLIGAGVPATEYGPVSLGSFLTADAWQYGQDVGVQVQACRSYDSVPLCQSTWSNTFPLGTPVDVNVRGLAFVGSGDLLNNNGTFSWTGWPPHAVVEYACGPTPGTFVPAGTDMFCEATASLAETPTLTIRVTANDTQYTTSYSGFDYD